MRVLYDGFVFSMQKAGGINRYFADLIDRLPEDFAPTLITKKVPEHHFPRRPNLRTVCYRNFRPGRISYRLEKKLADCYAKVEGAYLGNVTSFERFDLAHPTYYSLLTGREVSAYRCPVVLTVYDMVHERFPAQMDPTGERAEEKRKAVLAADMIICISENTKADLIERHALPDEKVKVIYLASGMDAGLGRGPETVPARPYYLYVGSRAAHKNFDGLLAALAKVAGGGGPALCVVGPPFTERERAAVSDLGLTRLVEHYGHVGDAHLAKLYRHSVAFVYPSLYEGFGIPLLEAMACETAVVAADSSSIPEVVGDAGLLFDPRRHDDLADILSTLPADPAGRERLIAKGRRRAKEFSWDKTAAETIAVYRSVGRRN